MFPYFSPWFSYEKSSSRDFSGSKKTYSEAEEGPWQNKGGLHFEYHKM